MDKLLHFLVASTTTVTLGQFVPKKHAAAAVMSAAVVWEYKRPNNDMNETLKDLAYGGLGTLHGVLILRNSERKIEKQLIEDMRYKIDKINNK